MSDQAKTVEELRTEAVRGDIDSVLNGGPNYDYSPFRIYKTTSTLVTPDDVDADDVETEVRCDAVMIDTADKEISFGIIRLGLVDTFYGDNTSDGHSDYEWQEWEYVDALTETFAPELSASIVELFKGLEEEEPEHFRERLRECLEEQGMTVSQVSDPHIRQFLQSLEAEVITGKDSQPEAST